MPNTQDGHFSSLFNPLSIKGNLIMSKPDDSDISEEMSKNMSHAPSGSCVCWGIPFEVQDTILVTDEPITISLAPTLAPWLVFMHTSDVHPIEYNQDGFISSTRGMGQLGEALCDYILLYDDGSTQRTTIRRRHQIGAWCEEESCVEAVFHTKPRNFPGGMHEMTPNWLWGAFQTHLIAEEAGILWKNWIWAWENPHPDKVIVGLCFEPIKGMVLISGVSAGQITSNPLRWQTRKKALFTLPKGVSFDPQIGGRGYYKQIQLDMGQVISARQQLVYPKDRWEDTDNNDLPELSTRNILIEYAAHPNAHFHFSDKTSVSLEHLSKTRKNGALTVIPPAKKTIKLKVVEKKTGKIVPAKLHVHGIFDEYLTPVDRQRIANPSWFQDYTVDYIHRKFKGHADPSVELHHCTYIAGETTIKVPLGKVYLEISKGFEFRPVKKTVEITPDTREVVIELEKKLSWREKGWVTADTHVHFLSPSSACLEGSAEGVNVINLLASQWGELMTNVGDFDGHTTFGSKEGGGSGEYLVRVGTENRQGVLGHISLLGYTGDMITPLCSGGPGESALGDPVEALLTEWAKQCRSQNGLVVIPHFPDPRLENAATIVSGNVDGIEMASWGDLYSGISPYSLSDWYRYLNCGYAAAAVAGTDKMSASTAVGTIRTYAYIDPETEFTYESWKDAIRSANTFVTFGPLMEFSVEGKPPGSRIEMSDTGGTVDISWHVASVTVPMSRVDLIVNGEIRESCSVQPDEDKGNWSVRLDKSSWLALLIRGHYPDKPEIITAHSSPVMVQLKDSPFMAAADAVTILEQIEGAVAYIDTIGTRADVKTYKRMRLVLTSAHRALHNRMHELGCGHHHTAIKEYNHNH